MKLLLLSVTALILMEDLVVQGFISRRRRSGGCSAVSCKWGEYERSGSCSETCGAIGQQMFVRNVARWPNCGGSGCSGSSIKFEECRPDPMCDHGTWDGTRCQCEPGYTGKCCEDDVYCPQLENPRDGHVSDSSRAKHGETVTYTCNPGFQLTPPNGDNRRCDDGSWTGHMPHCDRVSCPSLAAVENGYAYGGGSLFDDTQYVSCFPGYQLDIARVDSMYRAYISHFSAGNVTSMEEFSEALTNSSLELCAPAGNLTVMSELNETSPNNTIELSHSTGNATGMAELNETLTNNTIELSHSTSNSTGIVEVNETSTNHITETFTPTVNPTTTTTTTTVPPPTSVELRCQEDSTWNKVLPSCKARQCTPLTSPKNCTLTGGNSYLDTVTFICDPGYMISGSQTRTCMADGSWTGGQSDCVLKRCACLEAPRFGSIEGSVGCYVGDTATFFCQPGYELQGDDSRLCQTTQQWTGSQPFCVKAKCHPLNTPTNGMKFGGNEYQDQVTFICITGYEIVGISTLTCLANQTWSSTEPDCVRSQCPLLPPPAYGDIMGGNEYGDTVSLMCEIGYRLEGSPTRTCMASKTWSGIETSCVLKTCPPLVAPDQGSVSGGNSYGEMVSYSCDTGYDMLGTPTRTCQDSEQWSGNQPYCLKVQCNTLNPPTAGSVFGGNEYGESVQFSCWLGHTLTGSSNRTCQEDGLWSGDQPTCAENECPELDSPPNGYKTGGNGYGDIVIFFCNDGYEMVGQEPVVMRTCEADKTWSGAPARCTRRSCPSLSSPLNGNVTGNNFFGDVVTITCDPGYELRGSSTRGCLANQQWNGTSTTCERVQCPTLSAISDGQMSGNNFFGDRTTFVCNTGYELSGSPSRTCSADGSWTGTQTACNRKKCPALSPPLNGNVTGETFYGETAVYTCSNGFDVTGSTTRTCQADQRWSGTEPTCEKIKCPILDPPPNGGVNGTNYYADTVVFDCDVGYELVGSQQRTCQISQQWSGVQPYCERKRCPQLTVPSNGGANGGIYYGDTAAYSCDPGYELAGSSIRTCQADGQWAGMQPVCYKKQCLSLQAPANGSISGGHFYGDQVFFSCDSGFELVGTPVRICEDNQLWSGVQPSCIKKRCNVLTPPAHGSLTGAVSFNFGEMVTFTCDPGYEIQGSGTRMCRATGQWSGTPAQCQKKCCDRPDIQNGDFTGTHCYNDTVTFKCNVGYHLLGSGSLACTEAAQWSLSLPTCERICCDSSISIHDGSVSFLPDNCHSGLAAFSCVQGYRLEGSNYIVCNDSGLWEEKIPTCERVCCGVPGTIRDGAFNATELCYGDVATYTCNPGFLLKGNASVVCGDGYWGKAPFCEPNSLCDRGTLAVPTEGSKICFGSPQGTVPVEYCQMHCNAPKVYNRNDDMYECSVETNWLWMIRIYHGGGQQVLSNVDVGECSASFDPFAAIAIGGLVITSTTPLDIAAIETEMKDLLLSTGLCSNPCEVGQISVDVSPTARVGPRSTSVQYQVSVQLLAYADPNLVTPTNTIQMEWVRLAGELRQVATTLETMVVTQNLDLSIAGSHMHLSVVDGGLQVSSPSLGCRNGEIKDGVKCIPCAPGTYHDVFEQICRSCSYATYQDEFGQTECKSCPNGTTTAKAGTKNITECKEYDDCDCGIHPCELTPGGYTCSCLPGYLMEGTSFETEICTDIDECQQPDVCPGARCINRPGTYSCQCLPGYEEPNCIDINECRYAGFCPENSDCTNTEGSYYCTCHLGFHGDDCLDVNECQNATLNICGPNQHCVNTKGSYTCLDCTSYQQNCYSLVLETATFTDAELKCTEYGGILATVPDQATQLFIIQLVGDRDTWIGLDDRLNEGQFMWSDGTTFGSGYSYWAPGEPNDASTSSSQDCVHLWPLAGFRWDDQPCDRMEHFVCQFSVTADPNRIGDGVIGDQRNNIVPSNNHDHHHDHEA